MLTPLELGERYVLPAFRRRLVELLREKGMSYSDIASVLGITRSAVARYLSAERGARFEPAELRDVDTRLAKLAEDISLRRIGRREIEMGLIEEALRAMGRGYVCRLHSSLEPGATRGCRLCVELFGSYSRESR
ncbi:MAG: sigma factor-like helix-turn-helix DNA-binding protein [Fervidicoccaceae archaeon]